VAATGGAGGLAGLGATAVLAVGAAFLGDERQTSAFFAGFFLVAAVFLGAAALGTWCFALVLPFAFFFVRI
jgi:hypothetical protein